MSLSKLEAIRYSPNHTLNPDSIQSQIKGAGEKNNFYFEFSRKFVLVQVDLGNKRFDVSRIDETGQEPVVEK